MLKHHPVDKGVVEKVVRHAQEPVHIRLHISPHGHVAQLGAEAAELHLQLADLLLRGVQAVVLDHGGDKPAADHIKGAPVRRGAQGVEHALGGIARRAARVCGFTDLAVERLLRGDLLLKLQDAAGLCAAGRLERFALAAQRLGIARFAAVERGALRFVPGNILTDGLELAQHAVVPDRGGKRLLPLPVEPLLLFAEHAVKQRGQAVPLQAVDIRLLVRPRGFQLALAGLERVPPRVQRLQHGVQLLKPRRLFAECLQQSVIIRHTDPSDPLSDDCIIAQCARRFEVFHKIRRESARETVNIHVFRRMALKTREKVCYTTHN